MSASGRRDRAEPAMKFERAPAGAAPVFSMTSDGLARTESLIDQACADLDSTR